MGLWNHRSITESHTQFYIISNNRSLFNPLGCSETCGSNLKGVLSKHMLRIKFVSISGEIGLRWRPYNTFDVKSTLVQVVA